MFNINTSLRDTCSMYCTMYSTHNLFFNFSINLARVRLSRYYKGQDPKQSAKELNETQGKNLQQFWQAMQTHLHPKHWLPPKAVSSAHLVNTLLTHDCRAHVKKQSHNKVCRRRSGGGIIVTNITNGNELAYRQEVDELGMWCKENSFFCSTLPC